MYEKVATAPEKASTRVRPGWPIYTMAVLVAGLIAALISMFFVSEALDALGVPDPGRVTTFGLPFLRGAAWILAALSVGSYMFAAFYISPQRSDDLTTAHLTVDGHIASRTGSVAALCFSAISFVMVPLNYSDVSGFPVHQLLGPSSWDIALSQIPAAQAWFVSAWIALATGLLGLLTNAWTAQSALALGAIFMIIPEGMEGHSAAGGDHDYGTNSYLWHLVFMAIWIGGLMALVAHARRLGPDQEEAVRRYSKVALFSIIAVAVSGMIGLIIRIRPSDLLYTRYGAILMAKIIATVVLAIMGFAHREITIPRLKTEPQAFRKLAIGEIVVMALTAGVAVTMTRTPPPAPRITDLNAMQLELGYTLSHRPTFWNVFTTFRFDIMFGTIAILLAVAYWMGVRRVRARGDHWSAGKTAWWMVGCFTLFWTTSFGIGVYMPAAYSMHMVGHMMLSMVVPLLMVLGAPLTLMMTVWEPGSTDKPNPGDWAKAFTESRFVHVISIPWVSLLQFMVCFYALYLDIPFYELAISEHAGHVIMNWVFVVSGLFYFWELIGPDPIPGRPKAAIRLFWLVVSMPIHLYFGVYLMQLNTIMGEQFYLGLYLPWNPDLLADQKSGGGIAWAFGSFPLTFVLIWLFNEWRKEDKAEERAKDAEMDAVAQRKAEDPNDDELDELEAYNQMLQRYQSGAADPRSDYYRG